MRNEDVRRAKDAVETTTGGAAAAAVVTAGGAAAAAAVTDPTLLTAAGGAAAAPLDQSKTDQYQQPHSITEMDLPNNTGAADQRVQLNSIRNGAIGLGGTRTRRGNSSKSKRDVTGLVTREFCEIRSSKLAMEQAVQLCVLGCGLAVRHLKGVGCVTGLLDEELGESDHLWVRVEGLC